MPKNNVLTQEDFDSLLQWFSSDREEAGVRYEEIRNGLIRYFHFKGCAEAENLADETINRVAGKLQALDTANNHKHITYFYGFAAKIYLEYRKKIEKNTVEFDTNLHSDSQRATRPNESGESRFQCLDECLAKLSDVDQNLMVQYFSKEKKEKYEHRRHLAEQLQINAGTLHVRIFRLKAILRSCVENCLKQK